jgi:hypothetical protein
MDKLSDIFKATIAVFHGIISTWLFLEFSETTVDQFQFLILLVFFTVGNVIIWSLILRCYYWIRGVAAAVELTTNDIAALRYRATDVAGLSIVAICVGLLSAYAHRHDAILRAANQITDWKRNYSDAPFVLLLSHITAGTMAELDGRGPRAVNGAKNMTFLRVYIKDSKIAYEGYPRIAATKRDPREIVLSPACRYAFVGDDPTKVGTVQAVEGPGVFLRLADTAAFEIIDKVDSKCAKIHDAIEGGAPMGAPATP